jgi:hypothetical protein
MFFNWESSFSFRVNILNLNKSLLKIFFINATRVGAVSNHQVRCIPMHGINCKIDIENRICGWE